MSTETREGQLLQTFAKLADTLVVGYDVVDLLQLLVETCRDLLGATAAGILLANSDGELELIASTSESSRLVEMMQLAAEAGPCVTSYEIGELVVVSDIGAVPPEWSRFRDSALQQGFAAVYAVPLRLRETTIGTLNLFQSEFGQMSDQDLIAAQAFADVATIGILHERSLRESGAVQAQLQNALNSRILIEQAKGVVAHSRSVSVDDAFALIRAHARANQLGIAEVAAEIVGRRMTL
ncbi:GAF domain-containing protein [Conyzicola lurida]|uniref:GAF domain-containing protein n=1 Tax=Conyzicola lurida TaxID=1172621 RepID=A0A841AQY6_9MICO|nr:GAF and ANTAR domain-containing protein [Conyzicola lurida]MBB5844694.1 GAF domain-containing protein [Conyzicola lurida]